MDPIRGGARTTFVPLGSGSRRGRGRGYCRITHPPTDQQEESNLSKDSKIVDSLTQLSLNDSLPKSSDEKLTTLATIDVISDENNPEEDSAPSLNTIGTKGRGCQVFTNFVKLIKEKDVPVFEYHVQYSNFTITTVNKKKIIQQLNETLGPVKNFDGQMLYLPFRLHSDIFTSRCTNPSWTSPDEEYVQVTIKFVQQKKFEELTPFINILFQQVLQSLGFVEIRRGYYEISEIRELLEHKLQVWPGVSLTVEHKDGGFMVMFDSPSRVIHTDTLYDFYHTLKKDPQFKEKFTNHVIGKIILCKYSSQCYKVDDIAWDVSPRDSFKYDKSLVTYEEYFRRRYKVYINDLDQPMLVSKIKPRKHHNPDEESRCVYLVPELCYPTGLTPDQRTNFKIMNKITSVTKLDPAPKINAMRHLLQRIIMSTYASKILKDWGIRLDNEVISVTARKISQPQLLFSKDSSGLTVEPNFMRESSAGCYDPVNLKRFLIFCTKYDAESAKNLLGIYKIACSTVGIKMSVNGEIILLNGVNPSHYVAALEKYVDPKRIQFVIIIMASLRDDVYSAVKKFCLASVPIPSQCIQSRTLRHKAFKNVALKICLQINCKLGGAPWGIKLPLKKVMFIGMDAAHDPTRKNPSVIALVASMNDECTKYYSKCNYLPIHQEVCVKMRIMFSDALREYRMNNRGELPTWIILYRDGGNAGTFEVLLKYEAEACLEVLREQSLDYEEPPKFSYVCVSKRIPQRLFLVTEGNKITNPQPGTILDHTITNRNKFDFYCVSQQVHQSTVNPTHYTVLYETVPTKPDTIQQISYITTYMYFNYQGAIKVPAFIQYAHKLGQLVSRVKISPHNILTNNLYYL